MKIKDNFDDTLLKEKFAESTEYELFILRMSCGSNCGLKRPITDIIFFQDICIFQVLFVRSTDVLLILFPLLRLYLLVSCKISVSDLIYLQLSFSKELKCCLNSSLYFSDLLIFRSSSLMIDLSFLSIIPVVYFCSPCSSLF